MLVIFDLDDTLVDTSDLYWKVKDEFISLFKSLDIDPLILNRTFEDIDTLNLIPLGYHPSRYNKTMLDLIDHLYKKGLLNDTQVIKEEANRISKQLFYVVPDLIPGAIPVLEELNKRHQLSLISRGIEEVQWNKINFHSLHGYFKQVKIVSSKTTAVFEDMIYSQAFRPEDTCIVGDSIKSEIKPCLTLGANCIHFLYQHHTYNWVQEHGEKAEGTYFEVASLHEVPGIINNLNASK